MPIIALLSMLFAGIAASAAAHDAALHTVAGLDAFADDPARRYTPFCVTGTVQSANETDSSIHLVISDPGGWIEVRSTAAYHPTPGEKVVLSGLAHMSAHHEIDIVADDIRRIGMESAALPIELPLGDICGEEHHLRPIVTEGTVIDLFPDEIDSRYIFLILKDAEAIMPVALRIDRGQTPDLESLRDARVRASGRFLRAASGGRKFSGPFILIDDASSIAVVVPAPDDPFDAPLLEQTLYRTPREIAMRGKRSILGEVLAVWSGSKLMMRTDEGRVVNVALAHGQSPPPPGASALAAGYPETDLFRINLTRAIVREMPAADGMPREQEAEITDPAAIFAGGETVGIDPACHGRLMRIRGVVQSVPSPEAPARRLLLACGPFKLSVDLGIHPDTARGIAVGTVVEVTGRCLLESDSWCPDDIFPRIQNVAVVIRVPSDIKIVARPPWWTPFRLLVVISILATALIATYIWNRILQRLVTRRGRELYREQVAHAVAKFKTDERTRLAVELHDSLSQSLAGIACQVSAGSKTLDKNPGVARRCIETADKMLCSCRRELRQCLFDLRSDTLDETDFSEAIRKTLDQLDGHPAITIAFNVPRRLLHDAAAHAILSIIRELAGNAMRHGEATEIKVEGSVKDGHIIFSVCDNGRGFNPESCAGPLQGHFGIESVKNRIARLDGHFSIDSKPGEGAKATATIPLSAIQIMKERKP